MTENLVPHAPSRGAAMGAQSPALDAFYIAGIRHNIPFLSALMNHPRWRAGQLSTGFIAEEFRDGFKPIAPEGERARVIAAVATAIDHRLGARKRQISGQLTGRPVTRATARSVWLNGQEYILDVTAGTVRFGDGVQGARPASEDCVRISFREGAGAVGEVEVVSSWKPGDPVWHGSVGGRHVAIQVSCLPNGFDLTWQGAQARAYVYTESKAAAARLVPVMSAADTGKELLCPMPRLVGSVGVNEGREGKAGETLPAIEAMKKQNGPAAQPHGT